MKFDPLTKEIFTDTGEFVKAMHCPYKMRWEDLEPENSQKRKCSTCDRFILDTKDLTDETLMKIVSQNADTCLKIDLNQKNIKVISSAIRRQK